MDGERNRPGRAPLARRAGCVRALRGVAAAGLVALVSGCGANGAGEGFALDFAAPETRIDYEIGLQGAPSESMADLIRESLGLYRRQEGGAQSTAFLRKRARDDVETVGKILRSRGYYTGTAEIDVAPPEDATLARVTVKVEPGPRFTLAEHSFRLVDTGGIAPPPLDAAALGSPVGGPAVAAGIVRAEGEAARTLRQSGRPYAEVRGRDAVADPQAATLSVESVISAGRPHVFGPVRFEGSPNVEEDYLRTYIPWEAGEPVDTRQLSEFQRRLVETGLFGAVSVAKPDTPPDDAVMPVGVQMEETPFRSIGAGVRFNTDTGVGVRGAFEHRNLFGANERLAVTLESELDEQEFDIAFTKPQFRRAGQFLDAELRTFRVEDSPFDAVGSEGRFGLRRRITDALTVGGGALFELAAIDEEEADGASALIGTPLFASWDTTDDLLNATEGQRARIEVAPFGGTFNEEATSFLTVEATANTYHALTEDRRFVLAGRTRLGTTVAADISDVPQTRRFYAGGGGSVRGFDRYEVGPLDDDNDAIGGLSVAEIGAELRFPVSGPVGGVVFTDAGTVSTESGFAFDDDFLVAAGLGLRYYSPVGPIRLDVAFPVNGRSVDNTFEVYFAVGQAF